MMDPCKVRVSVEGHGITKASFEKIYYALMLKGYTLAATDSNHITFNIPDEATKKYKETDDVSTRINIIHNHYTIIDGIIKQYKS